MLAQSWIARDQDGFVSSIHEIVPDGRWFDNLISNHPGYRPRRPHVSPSGGRIAYDADAEEPPASDEHAAINREIYAFDIATRTSVRLTDHPAADTHPSFAQGGNALVFVSDRDGNDELYLMHADGTGVRRLTDHPARDTWPSASPDGRTVVFQSDRAPGEGVYALDIETGTVRRLTDPAYRAVTPRVAADGRSVVFAADRFGQLDVFRLPMPAGAP